MTGEHRENPYSANNENVPLYQAVRELVVRFCQKGVILDLGCNKLAASRLLTDRYQVIGLDINWAALKEARNLSGAASLIQADLTKLPFALTDKIDTVLALDVIEHLNWQEANELLIKLRTIIPDQFHLIVSMPIIDSHSIGTIIKRLEVAARFGRRPPTGLFDRTHLILTDRAGHRKLFGTSSFQIIEEYLSRVDGSLTGNWPNIEDPFLNPKKIIFQKSIGILKRAVGNRAVDTLTAYQGIYVLEPIPKIGNKKD